MSAITPAIMIGGTGTRLWPLSRTDRPKQFHGLCSDESLVQQTLRRFSNTAYDAPWLLTGEGGVALAETHADAVGVRVAGIVVEPFVRSTAPALAAAAYAIGAEDPDRLILAAPADHLMSAPEDFHRAVAAAAPAARAGSIVTFGIRPTHAETGFGYIAVGDMVAGTDGVHAVASFVEKPALALAQTYVAEGRHLWNAGIFLFLAGALITEVELYAPEVASAVRRSILKARASRSRILLDRESYASAPEISIDNAVMEKSERVVVAPCDPGWNDVGSWAAVHNVATRDANGNAFSGDVVATATRDCLIQSKSGRLIAVTGLEGIAVIDTDDVTLVTALDATQNVKDLVRSVAGAGRREAVESPFAEHLWGTVRRLACGPACTVRQVRLGPGREVPSAIAGPGGTTVTLVAGAADALVDGERRHLTIGGGVEVAAGAAFRLIAIGPSGAEFVAVETHAQAAASLDRPLAAAMANG